MPWELGTWECGGLLAERDDGERFYLYRRLGPPEGYVLRWRGKAAGEIICGAPGMPERARWVLPGIAAVSEQDLMEVVKKLGRG